MTLIRADRKPGRVLEKNVGEDHVLQSRIKARVKKKTKNKNSSIEVDGVH